MNFTRKQLIRTAASQGEVKEDAVFIGWQKMSSGKVFPLYNVVAVGHPSYGSTLTDKGLHKLHLDIPKTPPLRGSDKSFEIP